MSEKKAFLLRVDPDVFDAVQRWAADDLRSANGQIEFVLRQALKDAGRLPGRGERGTKRAGRSSSSAGNRPSDQMPR